MTLYDRIQTARQAQVDNEQLHDVQLPLMPFVEPEIVWATEGEAREQFHHELDQDWYDYIRATYGPED